jgi:hypothetical protein
MHQCACTRNGQCNPHPRPAPAQAIIEDVRAKGLVFRQISQFCAPDCIFTTNSLDITLDQIKSQIEPSWAQRVRQLPSQRGPLDAAKKCVRALRRCVGLRACGHGRCWGCASCTPSCSSRCWRSPTSERGGAARSGERPPPTPRRQTAARLGSSRAFAREMERVVAMMEGLGKIVFDCPVMEQVHPTSDVM